MVDGIEIDDNKYNPTKVFTDSNIKNNNNTSNTSIVSDSTILPEFAASTLETNSDFDHIYGLYIGSTLTWVVIQIKTSQSRNTDVTILICKHSQ